ncbi:GDSL esterase/lipase 1-like [Mangifera indica]|uniref:GDSL esterase/lipase 1-like n=1 Tax=Mangifera indica TaxID=29780 RepID=UPI001CF973E8|nr:GDSL esterase/lipase 1-like [Mangifera indica]
MFSSTTTMAARSFLCCSTLLFANILLSPISCHALFSPGNATHKALFVFGDSLFDPGNNQYLNDSSQEGAGATVFPYGETYFKRPTGRLCDGRTVPDLIAQFANLPILPPYLQPGAHQFTDGANFASAGAGVLDNTRPGSINLRLQLSYFKDVVNTLREKLGEEEAKRVLINAVYLFSIGGNDYFGFSQRNRDASEESKGQYVKTVINNLTSVLKEIYDLGGRKIAFQNVGPLGCVPLMKVFDPSIGSGCAEEPLSLARQHNRYLAIFLKQLETQLPGFIYAIFDYYIALGDRVADPSKFGFKEGKAACCGSGPYRGINCGRRENGTQMFELCSNPGEYVWFDGGHTTERANTQLAQLLWGGEPPVTEPLNMKQLFTL